MKSAKVISVDAADAARGQRGTDRERERAQFRFPSSPRESISRVGILILSDLVSLKSDEIDTLGK